MTVLKKKNRIVSFRVSEDEYNRLAHATAAHGANSISEYARTATLGRQDGAAPPSQLDFLRQRLESLQDQLCELAARVPD